MALVTVVTMNSAHHMALGPTTLGGIYSPTEAFARSKLQQWPEVEADCNEATEQPDKLGSGQQKILGF